MDVTKINSLSEDKIDDDIESYLTWKPANLRTQCNGTNEMYINASNRGPFKGDHVIFNSFNELRKNIH